MLSYVAGLRVGEIAALRAGDLCDSQGRGCEKLRFSAAVTEVASARS
jgi:integrase/recombinase XerD